jgi:hypothetical protein
MLSLDDMMAARRLKQAASTSNGGRTPYGGNNTFSYFTTPNGFAVEYTPSSKKSTKSHQHTVHAPGHR